MIRKLVLVVGGLAFIALVSTGGWFAVRAAYGAFDEAYYVTVDLPRAGQQLTAGSDVRTKGVRIGEVARIELVDHRALVQLKILEEYKIPKDAIARVELKTPLGAKYVDLEFPPSAEGPYLANGDRVAKAFVGPELEDLLADGTRLLEAIDPDDAATLVSELATAMRGRGDDVSRGIKSNDELSALFARTLDPQLEAVDDFNTIFVALDKKAEDFNSLAAAVNEGAPVYASPEAQRELRRVLDAVVPFSQDFSDLLINQRRDLDRMYEEGDKVLAVIASRPGGVEDLVHGLYIYVYKLGQPIGEFFALEDGSAGAGFTNFIGGNDQQEEQKQICTAFPPELRDQIPACEGRS